MMQSSHKHPHQATQTGFQGHASEDVRSIVEWIRDGAIGTVQEVHVFQQGGRPRPGGPPDGQTANPATAGPRSDAPGSNSLSSQIEHVSDVVPIPPEVKWDLWLGPAPHRNYNPMYIPLRWRNWLDFGTGILGDHGPHFFDPVVWALDLGFPESIEAETDDTYDPSKNTQTFPRSATVRYRFPAKGSRAALPITCYGSLTPPLPRGWPLEKPLPDGGGIILGSKGLRSFYGPVYNSPPGVLKQVWLLPEDLDKTYRRPTPTLHAIPPRTGSSGRMPQSQVRSHQATGNTVA